MIPCWKTKTKKFRIFLNYDLWLQKLLTSANPLYGQSNVLHIFMAVQVTWLAYAWTQEQEPPSAWVEFSQYCKKMCPFPPRPTSHNFSNPIYSPNKIPCLCKTTQPIRFLLGHLVVEYQGQRPAGLGAQCATKCLFTGVSASLYTWGEDPYVPIWKVSVYLSYLFTVTVNKPGADIVISNL